LAPADRTTVAEQLAYWLQVNRHISGRSFTQAFIWNVSTFVSDEKGKSTNGGTKRLKVPMRIQGADWIVEVLRADESRKERRVQPNSDSLRPTIVI
jgi:hypothetical protein